MGSDTDPSLEKLSPESRRIIEFARRVRAEAELTSRQAWLAYQNLVERQERADRFSMFALSEATRRRHHIPDTREAPDKG
jgi:hypothetical protein